MQWREPIAPIREPGIGSVKRVAIVTLTLLKYREPFYERLRRRLEDLGVELVLLVGEPDEFDTSRGLVGEVDGVVRIKHRSFEIPRRQLVWQQCLTATRTADLVIVEQASRLLVNYALLALRRSRRQKVAFWGHGADHSDHRSPLGESVKRAISRRVDWWFAYTDQTARLVADTGFPEDRITVVQNATDTSDLGQQVRRVTQTDIEAFRSRYSLAQGPTGTFLGSLYPDKRVDHLLQASDHIRCALPEFQLVIAGGGPEETAIKQEAESRPWVHVVGPQLGADLGTLLRITDLTLIPAWAGLVVVDSFAAGVPPVASASLPHGPEIAYVNDGINGRMVEDSGDPQRYAQAVIELLRSPAKLQTLREGAARAGSHYTIEAMVTRFADGVMSALSSDASAGQEPRSPQP